ncbi:GNAT family N-acetyltransferase [Anoxynatronum buryatiense]|uniref:Phosphinothricin acetyltransferase n=1 Tax=Anoxynatronum buryatiense TaxID=489973 RepID=A0AA45WUZ5_9CLOT|nr:GNAT family N-acetyltransferase [Anoxynatronum buryatiense]SMP45700.1 phosphinothricin acetyltransferase [Anoxynatronum buryatiense]
MEYTIETMKNSDWEQVAAIYLAGIQTGIATFQTEIPTWEAWDESHAQCCRLVARSNNEIHGWAAISPTSSRCVYAGVGEVSIYIDAACRGMGIGQALLNQLVKCSEENGYWTLQAGVLRDNEASRALHVKCGFKELGIREKLGKMPTGKWHDVVFLERRSSKVGQE